MEAYDHSKNTGRLIFSSSASPAFRLCVAAGKVLAYVKWGVSKNGQQVRRGEGCRGCAHCGC